MCSVCFVSTVFLPCPSPLIIPRLQGGISTSWCISGCCALCPLHTPRGSGASAVPVQREGFEPPGGWGTCLGEPYLLRVLNHLRWNVWWWGWGWQLRLKNSHKAQNGHWGSVLFMVGTMVPSPPPPPVSSQLTNWSLRFCHKRYTFLV